MVDFLVRVKHSYCFGFGDFVSTLSTLPVAIYTCFRLGTPYRVLMHHTLLYRTVTPTIKVLILNMHVHVVTHPNDIFW